MSPQQAEELTELEFNLAGLRARLGPSYTAIMGGAAKLAAMHGAYLSVHGTIFQGVQIRFGRRILEPKADVLGPLRITLDDCWEPVVKVGSAGVKHPANASFRVTIDDQFLDPASIERDLFSRKAA